jgi:glycosyltransferase involved in cell wall biosynthesis
MGTICVATPAYNAEKYIADSIESILRQTHKDFEFILIDDGSTDKTYSIIENYAKKDQRITLIKNETNLGISGNRNKILSLVKSKYLAWQDADDISMPQRLQHQYELMECHPEVGILGGYLHIFDQNGDLGIRKYPATDKSLRKIIFRYSPVAQPGAMIRVSALKKMGEYDLNCPPAEDLDMSFRIGSRYKFANLQEVVIKYRENNSSATFKNLKTMEINTLKIRKKYSKSFGYKMTWVDKLYNVMHFLSIYIVPAKLKIKLFAVLRNSKLGE